MNIDKLSQKIARLEGKKISLSIAQIKEVLKITLIELGRFSDDEIIKVIKRYRK